MAVRTNEVDVRYYFTSSDLDNDKDLTPIIEDASLIIDKIQDFYDATTLEAMEKYLTCHLISFTFHRQEVSAKRDDEAVVFTGVFTKGLNATSFGQSLLLLDDLQKLQELEKLKTVTYAV